MSIKADDSRFSMALNLRRARDLIDRSLEALEAGPCSASGYARGAITVLSDVMNDMALWAARSPNYFQQVIERLREVEIVTHFPRTDRECSGDYYDVEVVFDGMLVAKFGNHYDDKGHEKAEAWISGVRYIYNNVPQPKWRSVADREEM